MFQQEKKELLQKSSKDTEELEVRVIDHENNCKNQIRQKYEAKIKELEFKVKNGEAVFLENEKLRREIQEAKKTEKALIQVSC